MNNPIIRPLAESDIQKVVAIAQSTNEFSWSESVFRDCLKANYHLWVLEQSELIGFLVLLDQVNEIQLLNVAVAPEHQRRGYGRQLILFAVEYAKAHQFSQISLEVRKSNTAAISLYHALGFIDVGLRKNYYPNGNEREDALLMVLTINRQ